MWLGKDKLREGAKAVPLPSSVIKVAFWARRYDGLIKHGREKCAEAVRAALAAQIDPIAKSLADRLWLAPKPVVGEMQRPRLGRSVD